MDACGALYLFFRPFTGCVSRQRKLLRYPWPCMYPWAVRVLSRESEDAVVSAKTQSSVCLRVG